MMQPETLSLGLDEPLREPAMIRLGPDAVLLAAFAQGQAPELLAAVRELCNRAPLRHMQTPGGWTMSVAMTNCGTAGWVSDATGYRYDPIDPQTAKTWPAMPAALCALATEAATAAGFADFVPDACLINEYRPGARLSLHQDRNERDFAAPIV